MPQISKVRIVNISYKDSVFIADELFDLTRPAKSSRAGDIVNSLWRLHNGGGKSMIVQLIMQVFSPKATGDKKRKISEYFTKEKDRGFILVEMTKDNSEEKLLFGIALRTGKAASDEDENSSVKYYTFFTEYKDYSPYSISELNLSNNINNSFVPEHYDYVKELAKKSKDVLLYYSEDDKNEWNKKFEEYGIYPSEFNILKIINSEEGGIDKYFEKIKKSDELLKELIIPTIEERILKKDGDDKSDSSLETMLINYAKEESSQEEKIKERDLNEELIASLKMIDDRLSEFYNIVERKEKAIFSSYNFGVSMKNESRNLDAKKEELLEELELMKKELQHIEYEDKSRHFYSLSEQYAICKENTSRIEEKKNKSQKEIDELKEKEQIYYAARKYASINELNNKIAVLKEKIDEIENGTDKAVRIRQLKYSTFVKVSEEIDTIKAIVRIAESEKGAKEVEIKTYLYQIEKIQSELRHLEDEKVRLDALSNEHQNNTNKIVQALNLDIVRHMDYLYSESEVEEHRKHLEKELNSYNDRINSLNEENAYIDERNSQIVRELITVEQDISSSEALSKDIKEALVCYEEELEKIIGICERRTLDKQYLFEKELLLSMGDVINEVKNDIFEIKKEKAFIENKIKAIEQGNLHIISEAIDFLEEKGISYQTAEDYLYRVFVSDKDKLSELLSKYPELAYTIIVSGNKELEMLTNDDTKWLPAIVPVITMAQMESYISEEAEPGSWLALYDSVYFEDRDNYADCQNANLSSIEKRLSDRDFYLGELEKEYELIKNFDYDKTWKERQESLLDECKNRLIEACKRKEILIKEQEDNQAKKLECQEEQNDINSKILKASKDLDKYAELLGSMEMEILDYNKGQQISLDIRTKEQGFSRINEAFASLQKEISQIDDKINSGNNELGKAESIYKSVEGSEVTEIIEDNYRNLYEQYIELSTAQDKDIRAYKESLEQCFKDIEGNKAELFALELEESQYSNIIDYEVKEKQVKKFLFDEEKRFEELNDKYLDLTKREEYINGQLESAKKDLAEYNYIPLPQNEISDSFKERKKAVESNIRQKQSVLEDVKKKYNISASLSGRVSDALQSYDYLLDDYDGETILLLEDIEEQWTSLNKDISDSEKSCKKYKTELCESIARLSSIKNIKPETSEKISSLHKILENEELVRDDVSQLSDSIEIMQDTLGKMNKLIDVDLEGLSAFFEDIVLHCMYRGKKIYEDLRLIASKSKIRLIEDKPLVQMLKINLPAEDEIVEEASRLSIENEIRKGTKELVHLIKSGANYASLKNKAENIVGSKTIFYRYIRKDSVQIHVYKVDIILKNSEYVPWEDKSSGGEEVLFEFVVLASLMFYSRNSFNMLGTVSGTFLLMDNPFGKISSEHLITALFKVAEKFNIQLLCFSDIENIAVLNSFDCVMQLRHKSIASGKLLTHDGNTLIEHGFYKVLNNQLSLF